MYFVLSNTMSNYRIKSGSLNEYKFNSSHVNSSGIGREENSAVNNIIYEGLFFE